MSSLEAGPIPFFFPPPKTHLNDPNYEIIIMTLEPFKPCPPTSDTVFLEFLLLPLSECLMSFYAIQSLVKTDRFFPVDVLRIASATFSFSSRPIGG